MAALNILVLLILLSWTLALAFLLVTALTLQMRARRLRYLQLRPNCLLTRAPLIFVTGQRSFFYFLQYWNLIPRFLQEHGYLVEVWRLPWRNRHLQRGKLRRRLRRHLKNGGRPVHLFHDSSARELVGEIVALESAALASVTETDALVGSTPFAKSARGTDRWLWFGFILHRRLTPNSPSAVSVGLTETRPAWQLENRFLDRGIELAEAELTNS